MKSSTKSIAQRRTFIKHAAGLAATSALAEMTIPHVFAAEDNTIRLALIGCGGRGSGAVANAMSAGGLVLGRGGGPTPTKRKGQGPVKLFAMADILQSQIQRSHKALTTLLGPERIDVPPERQFVGFDAYRKAIDCLRPGDVAMLTTHAGFRPLHFEYAVEKGVNVFMEKNFAPDPAGIKKILQTAEVAKKKNLKVGAGLMARHSTARQALIEKIRAGAMGDIMLVRAYRMNPGYHLPPFPGGRSELMWQLHPGHPYQFLWSSGGILLELMIHQMDECFWIKNAWPIKAHGVGGRNADNTDCSQNLDSYSIEYTFPDGTKALVTGRYIRNCFNDFVTYIHGTKCAAQFSGNIHAPTSCLYKDQHIDRHNIAWKPPKEKGNPWQAEWTSLLDAIRNDRPYNEARRAALSNLGGMMGRAAVHTGQVVTWQQAMASNFHFFSDYANLTPESPAPVHANDQGRYPVPVPGKWKEM